MYYLVTGLILVASVLLVLIVLVQNSKGGGLASNFASSNQVMGVRKTADFLEKATWGLAISLLVFSLVATMSIPRNESDIVSTSLMQEQIENAPQPGAIPNLPTATPETATPENETPPAGE
ncbi:MAG: preprotein translocase subunit SecG [Bacteroidetes bacterium]|jgi:preprotein translocase subunit SecG|nr:preprotein translocase subunit SecG [Bacteroidota bacterium]MBT6685616.1 preprotein translocase subunit SecG [Bacteroidota bacterium]MBT7144705.1 preprotein translocase subunit SecG [Bacteroidota bacterium]MBT7491387.1 preprotein translocase subunit SecG [Bacteroidota bacterium]